MFLRSASVGLLALVVTLSILLPTVQAGEVLDRVLRSGVLRVPNNSSWPPYSFIDENGKTTGFDIEVAEEVARRIGVALQVLPNPDSLRYTWAEQTSGKWNDEYDVVIGSMTPTSKRDENLDFPVVYYYALGSLAVHRDNTTINVPADASGKRIGVMKAANYELYIRREPFGIVGMEPPTYVIDDPVVVTYDSGTGPYDALEKGDGVELDGFIDYLPAIMNMIKNGRPFKVVGLPLYRVPQAVAVQPGDEEFANLLKKTIEDMRADGTLTKLSMKWFDFDLTSPP
jgi:polar amino acid transport system substrate-binding protein